MELVGALKGFFPQQLPTWAQNVISVLVVLVGCVSLGVFLIDKGHDKYFQLVTKQLELERQLNFSNPDHVAILEEVISLRTIAARYLQKPFQSGEPKLKLFKANGAGYSSNDNFLQTVYTRVFTLNFLQFVLFPAFIASILAGKNVVNKILMVPGSCMVIVMLVGIGEWLISINSWQESLVVFVAAFWFLYQLNRANPNNNHNAQNNSNNNSQHQNNVQNHDRNQMKQEKKDKQQ